MQQLSLSLDPHPKLPRIRDCLRAAYGPQRDALRYDPTCQFFNAMISSRTYDEISNEAFRQLRVFLSSWEILLSLDHGTLYSIIQSVTYAREKADYLARSAQIIRARRGRIDLEFLTGWPVEYALDWLDSLPGAGPKVAAATLNFSTLRKRVFVIDTHVLRASKRLHLIPTTADFKRGFYLLMHLLPNEWDADDLYELHWLMKMHGQRICRHGRPHCGKCPLAKLCPSASTFSTALS